MTRGATGATGATVRGSVARALVSGALAAVAVSGLLAGPGVFGAVVTAVAALLVLDLCGVLARAGSRPVVVAAFVPGVGLPAAIAFWPAADWDTVPIFFAAGFAATFLLVLVFGRRRGVTAGVAATLVVSLLVGLGSSGILLLHGLPDGFRWVLGFVVLVAAADAGAPLAERLHSRRAGNAGAPVGTSRLAGAAGAVVLAAAAVATLFGPPFSGRSAALLAGVALVAAAGVDDLARALAAEARLGAESSRRLLGQGLLVGSAGAVLLGAPAAYLIARAI